MPDQLTKALYAGAIFSSTLPSYNSLPYITSVANSSRISHEVELPKESFEKKEQRRKQIAALAMKGTLTPRSKNGWRRTVGKYTEDSSLNRILDRGARIRESERSEE